MSVILKNIDQIRLEATSKLNKKTRSQLGQFLTPLRIADFMASLFKNNKAISNPVLLDAGAGVGTLTSAFMERISTQGNKTINSRTFEIDPLLRKYLHETLEIYDKVMDLTYFIHDGDFIEWAVHQLSSKDTMFEEESITFTHAILNPPYKKIPSDSSHRKLLREVGIETGNLYSAFLALAIKLMQEGGQIVAIIPRSFCNGPYFRKFRTLLLKETAIHHIHLFNSRNKAFKDDEVLQENVILLLERNGTQGNVTISTCTDDSFQDYAFHSLPFDRIVLQDDSQQFIHIPTSLEQSAIERSTEIKYSLEAIEVQVSTGPVVDFRSREYLHEMPDEGTVPLIYPNHFTAQFMEWPKRMKNPNAIKLTEETKRWLYPNGYYTVIKRFSSKEEKRRVVAGVFTPDNLPFSLIGFENGLNVLHWKKQGLPKELSYGLFAYLNSTAIDNYFRVFNGHTQVNATDLRTMIYPSRELLIKIGKWVLEQNGPLSQETIDQKLEDILCLSPIIGI